MAQYVNCSLLMVGWLCKWNLFWAKGIVLVMNLSSQLVLLLLCKNNNLSIVMQYYIYQFIYLTMWRLNAAVERKASVYIVYGVLDFHMRLPFFVALSIHNTSNCILTDIISTYDFTLCTIKLWKLLNNKNQILLLLLAN